MESYLKQYANTLQIDAAQYSNMNQVARTEVAKMILSERSLLPENKFISIQQIRHAYELAYMKSSSMPLSLSFVDTDPAAGSIGGEVRWVPGADDTSVVSYQLMWGVREEAWLQSRHWIRRTRTAILCRKGRLFLMEQHIC